MTLVVIDGLAKNFKKTTALKNVTLTVNQGEVFGIIGPDGAGKTTLLRLLTGVLTPTSGQIQAFSVNVVKNPDLVRDKIGVVPQNFSLYPDLTINENLTFFARIHQLPKQEFVTRKEKLLRVTRLAPFLHRRAEKLSGGMQKKLALICCLLHTPELLILDEPSTGIDPVSRRELWDFLYELNMLGMTIIVSTPYMDEAERCSRIGFLYAGEILVIDSPIALKKAYPYAVLEIAAPDPRRLAAYLQSRTKSILDRYPVGNVLHVVVRESDLPDFLKTIAQHPDHPAAQRIEPSFEDVFLSVIRNQP